MDEISLAARAEFGTAHEVARQNLENALRIAVRPALEAGVSEEDVIEALEDQAAELQPAFRSMAEALQWWPDQTIAESDERPEPKPELSEGERNFRNRYRGEL